MAKAGDGVPRSAARKREKIIRVRVNDEEHARFCAATRRGAHRSLASFLRDAGLRIASGPAVPPSIIGELGIIGGELSEFAELAERHENQEASKQFRVLSDKIARMQRKLME